MIKKIQLIFQETLNGPKDLSKFSDDFITGYKGIPDIVKELEYFAKDVRDPTIKYQAELFLNFIPFNSKQEAYLSSTKDLG